MCLTEIMLYFVGHSTFPMTIYIGYLRICITVAVCVLSFAPASFSQVEKGMGTQSAVAAPVAGASYALVVGISKYGSFTALNYADRDATVFYDYLRSQAGGSLQPQNIYFRTNDSATAQNIWRGVSWLERRADSTGETAIIYFSGHGDAANAAEVYLLAYDAPNEGDPNMYNMGGTVQIYNLKSRIKQMVARGVKVILITDACRTNDLPGKEAGAQWTFQSITEDKSGEIQMASCAGNEQSLEDKKWGNGRGVFSYHLLNGLSGLADNDPENGEVTKYELEKYVKENVRRDTRTISNNKPRQTPFFCCDEKNEIVVSKVDAATKAYVQRAILENQGDVSYVYGTKKGVTIADTSVQTVYNRFIDAIKRKQLIAPKGKSAVDFYQQLYSLLTDEVLKADLKDQMAAELINEAQIRISQYTKPPVSDTTDILNYTFFNTGALMLEEAMLFISNNDEMKKEMAVRKYFLEARALNETGRDADIKLGLLKIDSSLALLETAYGYHTKGLLLGNSEAGDDSAMRYYDKALALNKDWIYTLNNKGHIFQRRELYDSAQIYYQKALKKKPDFDIAIRNMASLYKQLKNYDSAIYLYKQAIALRPKNVFNLNGLGDVFYDLNTYDSATFYYKKVLDLDPENAQAFLNIAFVHNQTHNYDSARQYFHKSLAIYPSSIYALNGLGIIMMGLGLPDSASFYYHQSLKIFPKFSAPLNNIGNIFYDAHQWDSARVYYRKAISVSDRDALFWSNLGNVYWELKQYDSARFAYSRSIELPEPSKFGYSGLLNYYLFKNEADSAQDCVDKLVSFHWMPEFNTGNGKQRLVDLIATNYTPAMACVVIARAIEKKLIKPAYPLEEIKWYEYAAACKSTFAIRKLKQIYAADPIFIAKRNPRERERLDTLELGVMKKFTVPCWNGQQKLLIPLFISHGIPDTAHPVQHEVQRILDMYNAKVDPEVVNSFEKLYKIAMEHGVSYPDLCLYALNEANKEENK